MLVKYSTVSFVYVKLRAEHILFIVDHNQCNAVHREKDENGEITEKKLKIVKCDKWVFSPTIGQKKNDHKRVFR